MIYKRKPQKKYIKFSEMPDVSDVLPYRLEKNTEYHCLSVGQYNLIDIIEHVINSAGLCEVDVTVWTAADASMKKAKELLDSTKLTKMRWIIDPSFKARQPDYVETLELLFSGCIRTIPTHAKFILVYNNEYNYIIQTSMNLNQNKRLESFTVIEDVKLVRFYRDFFDSVFLNIPEEERFVSRSVTQLTGLKEDDGADLFTFQDIDF